MRRTDQTKKSRFRKGRVAAAVAAALLITALAPQSSFANTLDDVWGSCSITVLPSDSYEGLKDANVTLDFYQIAYADRLADADGYTLVWDESGKYAGPMNEWKTLEDAAFAQDPANPPITADDVNNLTKKLAGIVLESVPEYQSNGTAGTADGRYNANDVALGETLANVQPGLYLIIPHGNLTDYKNVSENGYISSVAETATKIYQFAPILVSVPQHGQLGTDISALDGQGTIAENDEWTYPIYTSRTSDSGDWTANLQINIKVGEAERDGALEIVKILDSHETLKNRKDPATFVFSVEATYNGNTVYSDVISMVFSDPGDQREIIKDLPVGAEVKVEEIYNSANSNSNYRLKSKTVSPESAVTSDGKIIIQASDPENPDKPTVSVTFENDYGDTWHGGGSVRNHFEANEDGNGWSPAGDKTTKTYYDDDGRSTEPLIEATKK